MVFVQFKRHLFIYCLQSVVCVLVEVKIKIQEMLAIKLYH